MTNETGLPMLERPKGYGLRYQAAMALQGLLANPESLHSTFDEVAGDAMNFALALEDKLECHYQESLKSAEFNAKKNNDEIKAYAELDRYGDFLMDSTFDRYALFIHQFILDREKKTTFQLAENEFQRKVYSDAESGLVSFSSTSHTPINLFIDLFNRNKHLFKREGRYLIPVIDK